MANQRKQGKKKIGVWVDDDEKAQIHAQLEKHGMKTVAELLKAVREGRVKIDPKIQALLIAAAGSGAEQSGCGLMTLLVLASPVALWLLS